MRILFLETEYVITQPSSPVSSYGIKKEFDTSKLKLIDKFCWENKISIVNVAFWNEFVNIQTVQKKYKESGAKAIIFNKLNYANNLVKKQEITKFVEQLNKKTHSNIQWAFLTHQFYSSDTNTDESNVIKCNFNGITETTINQIQKVFFP